MGVNYDSQVAMGYMKDSKYRDRTKHIDIKNSFVRDIMAWKEVVLKYIPIYLIVTNAFTKLIPRDLFQLHVRSFGLYRIWDCTLIACKTMMFVY